MEQLEGRLSVLAALQARRRNVQVVLIAHGSHLDKLREVIDLAEARGVAVRYVDRRELDAMAHGATHGGVIAVASPRPRTTCEELYEQIRTAGPGAPPLFLLLEGIDDARNLGFVIRTAEATGCHAVLIKKHLWDFDATEVARPSSGAYERLPLAQIEDVEPLKRMQSMGMKLLGCIAGARKEIYQTDLTGPTILAIGGEKRGLSGAVRSICDGLITIPIAAEPSSLSLSHAAAIALGEAMRQRRATVPPAEL